MNDSTNKNKPINTQNPRANAPPTPIMLEVWYNTIDTPTALASRIRQ